jgi:hypothetical protein
MIIDLRNEEDKSLVPDLRVLQSTTQNQLVLYFKKMQIAYNDIDEIYLGESLPNAETNSFLAANIATKFDCKVHFECKGSPGTAFPSNRKAAHDNYLRRRAAGERIEAQGEDE